MTTSKPKHQEETKGIKKGTPERIKCRRHHLPLRMTKGLSSSTTIHKPCKAQLKKAKSSPLNPSPSPKVMDPPSSSSSSAPPPSVAPKKSLVRRMLPFLLAINVAGAYVLTRTYTKKEVAGEEEVMEEAPAVPVKSTTTAVLEKVSVVQPTKPVQEPVKVLPPIPDDEQRQLFKWILEEKRKVKTKDSTEKKKIDEEKALLKHYIRAKSLPTL